MKEGRSCDGHKKKKDEHQNNKDKNKTIMIFFVSFAPISLAPPHYPPHPPTPLVLEICLKSAGTAGDDGRSAMDDLLLGRGSRAVRQKLIGRWLRRVRRRATECIL